MPFCIGWVENFDEITLSCTVKKIEANSCWVSIFGKNSKNLLEWPPFLGKKENVFPDENCKDAVQFRSPCGSKISMKSLYLARLRR